MTRSNRFPLLFAFAALLILSACQSTGGGYSWDYQAPQSAQAQQPPKSLADDYNGEAAQVAEVSAETLGDVNAQAQMQPPLQPVKKASDGLPPVKIAILLPLSGQHASLGQSMLNAAQMALFDVGHTNFQLVPYDTQGTSTGGREAAQNAVRERAQLVLGPVFADAVRAAKAVTGAAGINMIAFSTDWQLAGDNTFIMGFLPFDQLERIVRYAAVQNIKNVAVFAPQSDYGRAVVSGYRVLAPKYGLNTADISSFSPESSNLSPALRNFTRYDERIRQAKAAAGLTSSDKTKLDMSKEPPPFDAVLMPVGGDMARSIGNLLSNYDLPPGKVKRLGTGLMDDEGLASESSLSSAWFAAPSPRLRESFERRYIELYRQEAPRLSTLAYDATALSAVLAQRGLQTQGQPMFDKGSIGNPNGFAGIDGIFRFRPDGTAERGLAVLELRRGVIRIIDDAPKTFQHGFGG